MSALIPLESVNALELFDANAPTLDALLARIRAETASVVPDVATVEGRKAIASLAYKVARSKTTIDDAGKDLVAEWKLRASGVDAARKKARDYLDALRDEVRKPLDDYEAEQERIEQARIAAEAKARADAEAERIADIERREAAIREREAALAKIEQAARDKEAAEQAERDRIAREERIRVESEERAARAAREAVERAQREAEEARERERLAAEKAEADRIEAESRAKADKAEAVRIAEERAKLQAEERERARLAEEKRIADEEAKRAANKRHRATINNAAMAALIGNGIADDVAKQVVTLIAQGSIPGVTINY